MLFQREPPFLIDFHATGGGEQLCYVDVGRHGEWGGCPFPEGSEQIDSNARDCRWRMASNFAWRRKGEKRFFMARRSAGCPRRRSGLFRNCEKVSYYLCHGVGWVVALAAA